jgi:Ras GTPase-activating-like protein IQGAP2/3
MSSVDGRSARQSKRYSVTALYLSMSANERDMEIEDDLAKGTTRLLGVFGNSAVESMLTITSTKDSTGPKDKDICTIQEKLCS